jgi:hypothetical protein
MHGQDEEVTEANNGVDTARVARRGNIVTALVWCDIGSPGSAATPAAATEAMRHTDGRRQRAGHPRQDDSRER